MKYIYLLLSFLISFAEVSAQTDTSLIFSLQIMEIEKSKDSHKINKTWRFNDYNISYIETNTLRKGFERYFTDTLRAEKMTALREVIDASLQKNIKKPNYDDFKAPCKITHCIWELKWRGQDFRIELYDLSKNITEDRIYQKLQQIVELLGSW